MDASCYFNGDLATSRVQHNMIVLFPSLQVLQRFLLLFKVDRLPLLIFIAILQLCPLGCLGGSHTIYVVNHNCTCDELNCVEVLTNTIPREHYSHFIVGNNE